MANLNLKGLHMFTPQGVSKKCTPFKFKLTVIYSVSQKKVNPFKFKLAITYCSNLTALGALN
jgi:hypothetical protein